MKSLIIDILNSEAEELLQNLAGTGFKAIRKVPANNLNELLKKLRSKNDSIPSMEEITQEVMLLRTQRYAKPD